MKPQFNLNSKVFILSILLLFYFNGISQNSGKLSYQAVIRNAENNIVVNQIIGIRISLIQGNALNSAVYIENQRPTTNDNGLISIQIGNGYVETGNFESIDWVNGPYFIRTEVDLAGNDNYSISGISELLGVPYAVHAKTAESIVGGIQEKDPVFTQWDKSTGININESQVVDLKHFTNNDESDPVYSKSVAAGISLSDTVNWNNKLDSFTETDPEFNAWDKSSGIYIKENQISDLQHFTNENETDPVYNKSAAKNITLSDINKWDSKSEFSGDYNELSNKPKSLGEFNNDVGYQLASDDKDTSPLNEIQILYGTTNEIGITGGNKIFLPSFEGDPQFNASQAKNITNAGSGQVITNGERNKLNSIEAGGEVNVQSDWNETDINSDSYIRNKIDTLSLSNRIQNNRQGIIDSTAALRISVGANARGIVDSTASLSNRIQNNRQGIIDSTAALRTGIGSNAQGIVDSIAAIRNSMTDNIHDADNDTKIQTEESTDEDIIRFDVAGNEAMAIDGSGGTTIKLPTNDNTSSVNITKNDGTTVLKVDGSGQLTGDGSGLSNVRPKLAYAQGNQSVYFHEGLIPGLNLYEAQIMREVTISCPGPGQIVAQASGYADWESKNEDLVRIWFWPHPTVSPTSDWQTPDFHNLVILSDYQCADSSDQYASWTIQKVYNIPSAQNYTVRVCADKPFTSSKFLIGDCSLQLMFFPTGGTGGGTAMPFVVSSDALNNKQEFEFSPESVDGSPMPVVPEEKDMSSDEKISALENRIKRLEELLQQASDK